MASDVEQHDEHVDRNPSSNATFDSVLGARLSRRAVLRGSVGAVAGTFLGTSLSACGDDDGSPLPPATEPRLTLNFQPVAKSLADTVVVPAGYTATVLFRLGDPMAARRVHARQRS